jgi:hypothetical protein
MIMELELEMMKLAALRMEMQVQDWLAALFTVEYSVHSKFK